MSDNKVKDFFNSVASKWDSWEEQPDQVRIDLLNQINLKQGDKVLDIACGTGIMTSLIHNFTKETVVGIDLSEEMISVAKEKYRNDEWAKFITMDLFDYQNEDNINYAILYNAYPHFLKPNNLAQKMFDILPSGGHFVILHSLSKERLNSLHNGISSDVSRMLLPIEEEIKFFQPYFEIEKYEETDHSIIIICKKTK